MKQTLSNLKSWAAAPLAALTLPLVSCQTTAPTPTPETQRGFDALRAPSSEKVRGPRVLEIIEPSTEDLKQLQKGPGIENER